MASNIKALSLFELNKKVQDIIQSSFTEGYWVVAEISEIKTNSSGHCYLELIEKSKHAEDVIARARATIWSYTFRMLKPFFETTTGQILTSGIKVMLYAHVNFHEVYGLSFDIKDIDPAYTIGDLEIQKQQTVNRLIQEGVFNLNKELSLTACPQKIAVISSKNAAGYEDFIDQLTHNPYGYKFYYKLFPALMQGERASESIIKALEKIYTYHNFFDAVVIIRGGGSQADLNCFNNYWLAYHLTQFPLPVITGIGHEKDDSIVDLVANQRLKTPTAVAELLISLLIDFESNLTEYMNLFTGRVQELLSNKKSDLFEVMVSAGLVVQNYLNKKENGLVIKQHEIKFALSTFLSDSYYNIKQNNYKIASTLNNLIKIQKLKLSQYTIKLKLGIDNYIKQKDNYTKNIWEKSLLLTPENVLKRGFSVARYNGKLIRSIKDVEEGSIIETTFVDGKVRSNVTKTTTI